MKDPSAVLSHLLSVFSYGSQLFSTMNDLGRRLEALEKEEGDGLVAAALQCSKRFGQLEKKMVTLEQQQLNQTNIRDKNVTTRLEDLHTRIQQLKQKNTRQTAEIETLQAQLLYSTWNTSSVFPLLQDISLSR